MESDVVGRSAAAFPAAPTLLFGTTSVFPSAAAQASNPKPNRFCILTTASPRSRRIFALSSINVISEKKGTRTRLVFTNKEHFIERADQTIFGSSKARTPSGPSPLGANAPRDSFRYCGTTGGTPAKTKEAGNNHTSCLWIGA